MNQILLHVVRSSFYTAYTRRILRNIYIQNVRIVDK